MQFLKKGGSVNRPRSVNFPEVPGRIFFFFSENLGTPSCLTRFLDPVMNIEISENLIRETKVISSETAIHPLQECSMSSASSRRKRLPRNG